MFADAALPVDAMQVELLRMLGTGFVAASITAWTLKARRSASSHVHLEYLQSHSAMYCPDLMELQKNLVFPQYSNALWISQLVYASSSCELCHSQAPESMVVPFRSHTSAHGEGRLWG